MVQAINDSAYVVPQIDSEDFSSERWLLYFQQNKENRVALRFQSAVAVPAVLRPPLIRSLQRFQIGETGEGKFLRRFAKRTGDEHYEQCIDLFIKEEQSHARMLAEVIAVLDGTLLSWHWSDAAFIVLRRMLGLKTELFILLIAEIVGKCFYSQVARHIGDRRLCDAFSLMVLDEVAHLEFHCDFLRTRLQNIPAPGRALICWLWSVLFYAAALVFVLDHGETLIALHSSKQEFLAECTRTFQRATRRCLGF